MREIGRWNLEPQSRCERNVIPERIFESAAMPHHGPTAVDANGNVYALNDSNPTGVYPVVVFGATSSGIVNPLFTVSGPNTLLNEPTGLSVPPLGTRQQRKEAQRSSRQ